MSLQRFLGNGPIFGMGRRGPCQKEIQLVSQLDDPVGGARTPLGGQASWCFVRARRYPVYCIHISSGDPTALGGRCSYYGHFIGEEITKLSV